MKSSIIKRPVIGVTLGDVAGIGPEVAVRAVLDGEVRAACDVVVIGHPAVVGDALKLAELSDKYAVHVLETLPSNHAELQCVLQEHSGDSSAKICCWNPAGDEVLKADCCVANAAAGQAAFEYLTAAIELAQAKVIDAIVTAPLNKEALHLAGHQYPGHTEILAERCGVQDFAMMLHLTESRIRPVRTLIGGHHVGEAEFRHGLSIAHVTLHTSIASVPPLLTEDAIAEKIELMRSFLTGIGCQRRAIGVCALNPHAGENGLFGDEEARLIEPAVQKCQGSSGTVTGPLPVDTLVRRAFLGEFDGLVAMYHDQGHIPVKLVGFDSAVNITLGLPIIRTSPTHGTAFDRAWNSATPADPSGMIEATLTAVRMVPGQHR
jgi:4-hydroxythreonine-4-phosphate dehydrogenase